MGIFDFFKSDFKKPSIDLTDFKFVSDNHTRFEKGVKSSANNKGAWRGIRVQTNDNKVFTVAMYNLTGTHPLWGDNIQMAPKQMQITEENDDKIILKGFGSDSMGASFADYGLTLHKNNNEIQNITLHMLDRNVEIIYEKGNSNDMNKPKETPKIQEISKIKQEQTLDSTLTELNNLKQKWDNDATKNDCRNAI